MEEKKCKKCRFSRRGYQKKIWCRLAGAFVTELGDFCPKELTIEKIKKSCRHYDIKNVCCTVHVAEGHGTHRCWIDGLEGPTGLERDPDFSIKEAAA